MAKEFEQGLAGNSPAPQLSTEVAQGLGLVVRPVWRIHRGFIPMPAMLGWLEEWDLQGQSTGMLTDRLSSLVVSAQSDFLNGTSERAPSQEVDTDHLLKPLLRNWHILSFYHLPYSSTAIFYHSKQSWSPLRFTGSSLVGRSVKECVVLYTQLSSSVILILKIQSKFHSSCLTCLRSHN